MNWLWSHKGITQRHPPPPHTHRFCISWHCALNINYELLWQNQVRFRTHMDTHVYRQKRSLTKEQSNMQFFILSKLETKRKSDRSQDVSLSAIFSTFAASGSFTAGGVPLVDNAWKFSIISHNVSSFAWLSLHRLVNAAFCSVRLRSWAWVVSRCCVVACRWQSMLTAWCSFKSLRGPCERN